VSLLRRRHADRENPDTLSVSIRTAGAIRLTAGRHNRLCKRCRQSGESTSAFSAESRARSKKAIIHGNLVNFPLMALPARRPRLILAVLRLSTSSSDPRHPKSYFLIIKSAFQHRARPTTGSDCGSLRSHNLTLFVRCFFHYLLFSVNFSLQNIEMKRMQHQNLTTI
jgi:hypothetical protein